MSLASELNISTTGRDSPAFPFIPLQRSVLVLLGGFGALAAFVTVMPAPTRAERSVDRVLHATRGSAMFGLGRAVSFIGSAWFVAAASVLVAAFVWTVMRRRRLAVLCLAGPALAGVGEIVMKNFVGRTRLTTRLLTGASGYGFPSGHTAGAAALAVVLVIVASFLISNARTHRLIVGAAVLYAVAVGISRVVVGAHYALDVVGGWLFGAAVALIAFFVITSRSGSELSRDGARALLPDDGSQSC